MLKKFEKIQKADWTKVAGLNTWRNDSLIWLYAYSVEMDLRSFDGYILLLGDATTD